MPPINRSLSHRCREGTIADEHRGSRKPVQLDVRPGPELPGLPGLYDSGGPEAGHDHSGQQQRADAAQQQQLLARR